MLTRRMRAVGDVPLEWYKDELHVGYDREGRKVLKGPRRDRMDRLLAQADGGAGWRTVYDEYNGEEIVLSKEEFRMIQRIREGRFPHVEVIAFGIPVGTISVSMAAISTLV